MNLRKFLVLGAFSLALFLVTTLYFPIRFVASSVIGLGVIEKREGGRVMSMTGLRVTTGLFWLLLIFGPFTAVAAEPPRSLNDGFTVQLSAWVEEEVENDLLSANLTVERSGSDSARLAQAVAGIMQRALLEAERYPRVKVKSTAYATLPIYERRDGRSERTGWRVQQQLSLESGDIEAAAALVGRLQALDLQLTGLGFTVSEARREAVRSNLTAAAIDAWRVKAEAAIKRLGGKSWRPHELNIQDDQYHPARPMLARSDAMSGSEATAPAIEAGSSKIRITVSGSAWGR